MQQIKYQNDKLKFKNFELCIVIRYNQVMFTDSSKEAKTIFRETLKAQKHGILAESKDF